MLNNKYTFLTIYYDLFSEKYKLNISTFILYLDNQI